MFFIKFEFKNQKIEITARTRTELYIKILDWLFNKGYKFEGDLHKAFIKKTLTEEEVGQSSYTLNRFHKLPNGMYFYLYRNKDVQNFWVQMLEKFGIDKNTIEIKNDSSYEIKPFSEFDDFDDDFDDFEEDFDIDEENQDENPGIIKLRTEFWNQFLPEIQKVTNTFTSNRGSQQRSIAAISPARGIYYGFLISGNYVQIHLELWREKEDNKKIFDYLLSKKEEIEKSYGTDLSWERKDEKKGSSVCHKKLSINAYDKSNWPEINDFFTQYFPKFEKTFDPYLSNLDKNMSNSQDIKNTSNLSANDPNRASNPFRQCVCILGDPGVGKSVTAIETIQKDTNHKFYLSIPTDLSTSMLLQFVKGNLELNRVSNMIIEAYKNPDKKYTVIIDEFHKPLTIKRVNDELLQAISTKRYRERRFISSEIAESFISRELINSGFTEDQYSFHGNIEVPRNFGFVLLSSKPNVIVDNEDLYDRMDIVYLRLQDQGTINTIQDLESKKIEISENKKKFKELIKSQDKDNKDDDSWRESFDAFLNEISPKFTNERLSNVFKFSDWRKL
jgi:hypothetical protein